MKRVRGVFTLLAVALVGCAEEAPATCEFYVEEGDSGYWRDSRIEDPNHEAIVIVEMVSAADDVALFRSAFIGAACAAAVGDMSVLGGEYAAAFESLSAMPWPHMSRSAACEALLPLTERFQMDYPEVAATVVVETRPRCGLSLETFARDVAFCDELETLDSDAVMCDGDWIPCQSATADACLACVGELSYAVSSASCADLAISSSRLTPKCIEATVTGPSLDDTPPYEYQAGRALSTGSASLLEEVAGAEMQLEGLEALDASVDDHLVGRRFEACRAPAHASIDRARASLEANVAAAQAVLDGLAF